MEFGIRDIYNDGPLPDGDDLDQANEDDALPNTPSMNKTKKRPRKLSKKGAMRDPRPANVAADSDY